MKEIFKYTAFAICLALICKIIFNTNVTKANNLNFGEVD